MESLISAHCLTMLYICTKFCEKLSKGFRLKFLKGHDSVKNVSGISVLNLCISSDSALYLYQVSRKYLKGYQSYLADAIL